MAPQPDQTSARLANGAATNTVWCHLVGNTAANRTNSEHGLRGNPEGVWALFDQEETPAEKNNPEFAARNAPFLLQTRPFCTSPGLRGVALASSPLFLSFEPKLAPQPVTQVWLINLAQKPHLADWLAVNPNQNPIPDPPFAQVQILIFSSLVRSQSGTPVP